MSGHEPMSVRHAAERWAATWQRAWEARDTDAILPLYAPGTVFSSEPFRAPFRGSDGVREYVGGAFAEEAAPRVWVGTPVVDEDGRRAAVEWWAALTENGAQVTLAGTSVLRFDAAGLVTEQRDSWNQAAGLREPPGGWGR
jgi:ketosteroid isomerase-like protein